MNKKLLILLVLVSMILVGCGNRTTINLFDYTPKPAIQLMGDEEIEERMLEIIER